MKPRTRIISLERMQEFSLVQNNQERFSKEYKDQIPIRNDYLAQVLRLDDAIRELEDYGQSIQKQAPEKKEIIQSFTDKAKMELSKFLNQDINQQKKDLDTFKKSFDKNISVILNEDNKEILGTQRHPVADMVAAIAGAVAAVVASVVAAPLTAAFFLFSDKPVDSIQSSFNNLFFKPKSLKKVDEVKDLVSGFSISEDLQSDVDFISKPKTG